MAPGLVYNSIDEKYLKILNEDFVTPFRTGYVAVDEFVVPEYYKNFGDEIKRMRVREDDVWICSFPKCGTTWTQEMVWLIAKDLDYEGAREPIQSRFPFLEHTPLFDYREFSRKHPDFTVPSYVSNSVQHIDKMPSPRFIKTHLPFHMLPEDICSGAVKPKIIYTSRNPKDCLVSYYHHSILMEGYNGTFENFYKLFLAGKLNFAPFWPHVLGYWNKRRSLDVLFLRYEDMKRDLASAIGRVAAFLGKDPYDDDRVTHLVEHLSFESMRNNRAVNYEPISEMNRSMGLIGAGGHFMRSGKVNEHKAFLNDGQIEEIDEWTRSYLKGSDFEP